MPFRTKETYGWVLPVVANSTYTFWFNSSFNWLTATFRYSELPWVTPNEFLMLSTNFSTYRYQYRTRYNNLATVGVSPVPCLLPSPLSPLLLSHPCGNGRVGAW